jgi:hypothetical protein
VTDDSGTHFVVTQAKASREWVTTVLEQFIRGKRFQVPPEHVKWLNMFS